MYFLKPSIWSIEMTAWILANRCSEGKFSRCIILLPKKLPFSWIAVWFIFNIPWEIADGDGESYQRNLSSSLMLTAPAFDVYREICMRFLLFYNQFLLSLRAGMGTTSNILLPSTLNSMYIQLCIYILKFILTWYSSMNIILCHSDKAWLISKVNSVALFFRWHALRKLLWNDLMIWQVQNSSTVAQQALIGAAELHTFTIFITNYACRTFAESLSRRRDSSAVRTLTKYEGYFMLEGYQWCFN